MIAQTVGVANVLPQRDRSVVTSTVWRHFHGSRSPDNNHILPIPVPAAASPRQPGLNQPAHLIPLKMGTDLELGAGFHWAEASLSASLHLSISTNSCQRFVTAINHLRPGPGLIGGIEREPSPKLG